MASIKTSTSVENWDDDADFQGDLFTNSVSTIQTTTASRVSGSVRSESNIGDEDWQVLITPNDDLSTLHAISSAKDRGIPIPIGTPSSALLGGSIKRLGKKKSQRKILSDDDWGDDLELPTAGLKLKAPSQPQPHTPAEEQDEFDDWGEGSLGIRFGGTKRDGRARGSSASAMSPSMGSCMTVESEDDDFTGLVLPERLDFKARLSNKLKEAEQTTPDVSPEPAQHHRREPAPTSVPDFVPQDAHSGSPSPAVPAQPAMKHRPVEDEDDFLADFDIGTGDIIDTKKMTVNRHVVVQKPTAKATPPPAARPATTLTFTDKPSVSKIPRPLQTSASRSKLTPIHEQGAHAKSTSRPMPTTTHAQLLRAKRSAPVLRSTFNAGPKPPVPFLPAGGTTAQSQHIKSKSSQHFRRDSDPNRPQSPAMRSYSRMSASKDAPETPSRAGMRRDLASAALQREAAAKRSLAMPKRRRAFGDGNELEVFDDLPTSAAKEKKFEKVPVTRGPPKVLRHAQSNSRLPFPDRMQTPAPPATPRSPTKPDSTPRFARQTAASLAREQRASGTRSRAEGQVMPAQTNWKAKVAASSPHTSPSAQRTRKGTGQKPFLINQMSAPRAESMYSTIQILTTTNSTSDLKGMRYNPIMQRWEGNEGILDTFSHPNTSSTTLGNLTTASTPTFAPPGAGQYSNYAHDRSQSIPHIHAPALQHQYHGRHQSSRPANAYATPQPPSPPRAPALISHITATRGVQVERGMVFDPRQMRWLKLGPSSRAGSGAAPAEDDDDPFAGLDDLKDDEAKVTVGAGGAPSVTSGFGDSTKEDPSFVGEEFDLGPGFIRRQREEENVWRRRVEGWVGTARGGDDGWRWAVRDLASLAAAENLRR